MSSTSVSTPRKAATMSDGMYPGADPTAPGGMSRKALAAELHKVHGWSKEQVQQQFGHMRTWSRMIDTVCRERLAREAEAKQAEARIERNPDPMPKVHHFNPDTSE